MLFCFIKKYIFHEPKPKQLVQSRKLIIVLIIMPIYSFFFFVNHRPCHPLTVIFFANYVLIFILKTE